MAIKKLDVLGTGFRLIGKRTDDLIVQSVPSELSMDHTDVLEIAQKVNEKPTPTPMISFQLHFKILQTHSKKNEISVFQNHLVGGC